MIENHMPTQNRLDKNLFSAFEWPQWTQNDLKISNKAIVGKTNTIIFIFDVNSMV